MDVQSGSEWYLLSIDWLNKWKEYVSFDTSDSSSDAKMEIAHPGMITNEEIIEEAKNLLVDYYTPYKNYNLAENLREDEHYMIVNSKVWNFLEVRYGGIAIKRYGVQRADSQDECLIEANLLKIPVHYFPSQKDEEEDKYVYTVYESRYATLENFRQRLARLNGKTVDKIKLWKAPIPKDWAYFYRNNLCEFKKHHRIRLDAELLKKKIQILNEVQFTMDDFLIVECK